MKRLRGALVVAVSAIAVQAAPSVGSAEEPPSLLFPETARLPLAPGDQVMDHVECIERTGFGRDSSDLPGPENLACVQPMRKQAAKSLRFYTSEISERGRLREGNAQNGKTMSGASKARSFCCGPYATNAPMLRRASAIH